MREFIIKTMEMRFLDLDEFMRRRKIIREKYKELNQDEREIYKWYFFCQFCMLREPLQTLTWEYTIGMNVDNRLKEEYNKFLEKKRKLYGKI